MLTTTATKTLHWQRTRYSTWQRQVEVFGAAIKFCFFLFWDKLFGLNSPEQRNNRAHWFVNTLLNLGPTFIKIGQSLSTRADLLPLEYVKVLSKLQDRVPQFDSVDAINVIETELGNSLHNLYQDFDRFPIASASLGQVHKAKLHTGEDVVVKVQRPGLKELFNLDFEVLHRLVRFANRYLPGTRKYDLEAIYQEFFHILYQEIDYVNEGKNATRFRENFLNYPRISVPEVYWRYTTKKVLTLEYLPGIKIDDRQTLESCQINTKEIIQLGICCYLKQLLQDGFFQSDPHPGNMAVNQEGSLIFYDFGTMAEVKPIAKEQMVKTFFAVLKKDTEEVVDTLTYMGLIEPVPDMTPVKRLIAFILEKFTEKPVDIREFDALRNEIYLMFEQQPFRLPPQMTLIVKSLTTLDGIARHLDPEYNLVAASQPFIRSITLSSRSKGNMMGELARQAKDFISYKLKQPSKTTRILESLQSRLELGEFEFRVRSQESDRLLQRNYLGIKCLIHACISGFTFVAGTILLLGSYKVAAITSLVFSGLWFVIFLRSLIKLNITERLDRLGKR